APESFAPPPSTPASGLVSHLLVDGLQVVPVGHCELSVRCTQVFVGGLQTGLSVGYCLLSVQVAVQVLVGGLQMGLSVGHCLLSVHPTHVFVVGSQTPVGAVQALGFAGVQATQMPLLQTGFEGSLHSESFLHWAVHVPEV